MIEHFTLDQVERYMSHALGEQENRAFERHLLACDDCRKFMILVLELKSMSAAMGN